MARRRGLVFTGIWLVAWLAAMMLATVSLAGAVAEGAYAAVPVLAIWLAGAGFGLWRVGRRFAERLTGERLRPERRPRARHRWVDDLPERGAGE